MRDVVAGAAVAARGALHEPAVFIGDRNRHAIDLQLDDPGDRLVAEQLGDALAVFAQLFDAVGVVEREHGDAMRHTLERVRPADRRLRCVGLSGVISSGCLASSFLSRSIESIIFEI